MYLGDANENDDVDDRPYSVGDEESIDISQDTCGDLVSFRCFLSFFCCWWDEDDCGAGACCLLLAIMRIRMIWW